MNTREFLTHFIQTNNVRIIKNGFQQSEFNSANVHISDVILLILNNYNYQLIECLQNGIVITDDTEFTKKMSYCTNFETIIDNLLGIFGYEFSKYVLFRINSQLVLNKMIKNFIEASSNYKMLEDNLKNFKAFLNNFILKQTNNTKILKINLSQDFLIEYKKLKFSNKHSKISFISDIFDGCLNDIIKERENISNFNEIKNAIKDVLELLVKTEINKDVTINTLEDLLIEFNNLDIDIGYNGSFIRMAYDLYKIGSCPDNLLSEYQLKTKLTDVYINNLEQWLYNIIEKITNLHSETKIKISNNFVTELINIIIEWFILLGVNMSSLYNIAISFEKTSRIQFKLIFEAVMLTAPKYTFFTPSQKTLIHYALYNKSTIQKSLKLMEKKYNYIIKDTSEKVKKVTKIKLQNKSQSESSSEDSENLFNDDANLNSITNDSQKNNETQKINSSNTNQNIKKTTKKVTKKVTKKTRK